MTKVYTITLKERDIRSGHHTGRHIAVVDNNQVFVSSDKEKADKYRGHMAGIYPDEVYEVQESDLVV